MKFSKLTYVHEHATILDLEPPSLMVKHLTPGLAVYGQDVSTGKRCACIVRDICAFSTKHPDETTQLIRIPAGTFANNEPKTDLLLLPEYQILTSHAYVRADHLARILAAVNMVAVQPSGAKMLNYRELIFEHDDGQIPILNVDGVKIQLIPVEMSTTSNEKSSSEDAVRQDEGWKTTAESYARNAEYYRGLLEQLVPYCDESIRQQDDGGILPEGEFLHSKIPPAIIQLIDKLKQRQAVLEAPSRVETTTTTTTQPKDGGAVSTTTIVIDGSETTFSFTNHHILNLTLKTTLR